MTAYLLILDSMTTAQRAVKYLSSIKINASVEKSTSKGGCAYGVRVSGSPEKVCRLLSAAGIECRRIVSN
ncbi:MAG: hypothetical protein NC084_06555 [Bacteroides sp.]|nr:hypothetical protein [Eubacterium sp.]MCM1418259.1 hypothetical protein [Roseburia sp.]MCM1462359.1 hypothetical protein [Bacteroides sp.]